MKLGPEIFESKAANASGLHSKVGEFQQHGLVHAHLIHHIIQPAYHILNRIFLSQVSKKTVDVIGDHNATHQKYQNE